MKDLYKILGVDRSATAEEIEAAISKRQAEVESDDGESGGDDSFQEAAEILGDPDKRAAYDAETAGPSKSSDVKAFMKSEELTGTKKRLLGRGIVLALVIVGLFMGYDWFRKWAVDPAENELVDTAGMITALEMTDSGYQAVIFDKDGKKTSASGYEKGVEDRGLSWSANGSHVYISSNRDALANNIYRWRPVANKVERRSGGNQSQSVPIFSDLGDPERDKLGLLVMGGKVMEYNPRGQNLIGVLPPSSGEGMQDAEGGRISMMEIYKDIGTSFKKARWSKNRDLIYAIMRRDGGEVFIVVPMQTGPNGEMAPPAPMFAGETVDFDISPDGSTVIVSQINYQFPDPDQIPPEFLVDGQPVIPYLHGLFVMNDEGSQAALFFSRTHDAAVADPKISPSGEEFVVSVGKMTDGNFKSYGLAIAPIYQYSLMQPNPAPDATGKWPWGAMFDPAVHWSLQLREDIPIWFQMEPLPTMPLNVTEPAYSPSWHPDGQKITFLKEDAASGRRHVYVTNRDGSLLTKISDTDLDYKMPIFSPQSEK
jgi:curved DNA-binding protein CbpA